MQVRLEALQRLHCIAPHLYLNHGAASLHPPTVLHQRLHDLVDQASVHLVDIEAEEVGGGAADSDQWLGQRHALLHRLHEDDHLVELEHAQQLKQLPVLLGVNLHEGELPRVAHDRDGDLAVHRLDLLQGGQHEHGSPWDRMSIPSTACHGHLT